MAFLVRERPHTPQPHARLWGSVQALPGDFKKYLVGIGIAGIGDFSNTLLILWATQAWMPRFGPARAVHLAMLFYVGYNVVYTASCYASGLLADRFPKHWVLAIGYALAVVPAIALLTPGDSFVKFGIVFGVSGLYMGVWETLESSTSATLLPDRASRTGFGLLSTVNGIGDFLSSLLVGVTLGRFSGRVDGIGDYHVAHRRGGHRTHGSRTRSDVGQAASLPFQREAGSPAEHGDDVRKAGDSALFVASSAAVRQPAWNRSEWQAGSLPYAENQWFLARPSLDNSQGVPFAFADHPAASESAAFTTACVTAAGDPR